MRGGLLTRPAAAHGGQAGDNHAAARGLLLVIGACLGWLRDFAAASPAASSTASYRRATGRRLGAGWQGGGGRDSYRRDGRQMGQLGGHEHVWLAATPGREP